MAKGVPYVLSGQLTTCAVCRQVYIARKFVRLKKDIARARRPERILELVEKHFEFLKRLED
jgi:hypothetical protein